MDQDDLDAQFYLQWSSAPPEWIAVHRHSDCWGRGDTPVEALMDLAVSMAELTKALEGHLLGSHLKQVQRRLVAPTAEVFIAVMAEHARGSN